jgi:hypothetical protein
MVSQIPKEEEISFIAGGLRLLELHSGQEITVPQEAGPPCGRRAKIFLLFGGTVKKGMKSGIAVVALTPLLALGLSAAFGTSQSGPADTAAGASEHPECYNEARLNDPNGFCYRTMGPWNSTKSSDEEVRSMMSVERMVKAGQTVQEIQRYYPDYSPPTKMTLSPLGEGFDVDSGRH